MSNLAASFPLFFFGAGCVAAAAFVLLEGTGAAIGRIPLWVPFIALGIIALAGGTLSVFAEPDEVTGDVATEKVPASATWPQRRTSPPTSQRQRSRTPTSLFMGGSTTSSQSVEPKPVIPARNRPVEAGLPDAGSAKTASAADASSLAFPDDAEALLKEIDLIAAEIHSSYLPGRSTPSGVRAPAPASNAPAPSATTIPAASGAARVTIPSSRPAQPDWLESEAPRKVAHCVGCGSVILHAKSPSQCQVCGEPLCSECRDRSLREGKPNLCPLCALLDTVHSKGSPTAQGPRRV